MKIYIANQSEQRVGGGFSFIYNLRKALDVHITQDYARADVFLVPSASMIKPELAVQAKDDGKKVILRVDNALKPSRNGGLKGMHRMLAMAKIADRVVYQCQWSKDYLHRYLGSPKSTIIYNGVDTNIFNTKGRSKAFGINNKYLYSCASKGETKRWEWVWWRYQQIQIANPWAELSIAGSVSTPVQEHGFDFFQGERWRHLGTITSPHTMADYYRNNKYLFAVYENDCYSNTYLEALACGMELIETNMTGGTPELLANWAKGVEFNSIGRMGRDYLTLAESL